MTMKIEPRHAYNYDADSVSKQTGLKCEDPSRTIQSQAKEADINTIARNFGLTGTLPQIQRLPLNEDFMDVMDFHTAMNQLKAAQASFDSLPAQIRSRFDNDPGLFVDFCSTEGNEAELEKLGLLPPKPPENQGDTKPPEKPLT